MSRHSLLPMLSLYLIAAIVPCGLAGIGLVWLVSGAEGLTAQPDPSKTVLDARIETAREIRRALATPNPAARAARTHQIQDSVYIGRC